ncbi:MAG TPA: 3-deoxy-manno-octulosonate cytidylyltransferase [Flavobacteriales bacterium]|nr:3-deoxy-manno-octulosonate cytidylyltransferase [Flavobacteriales bacterium]
MNIICIIPARFASTRFPGKPLVDIGGKSMIQRVYEQAQKAKGITKIIVATDDERIEKAVKKFGGNVVMTSPHHQSGTDRCAEVVKYTDEEFDIVINVQGDEPFIHPEQIEQVAKTLAQHNTEIASLVRLVKNNDDVFDPSKVKVTLDYTKKALYFSRSPIPFNRNAGDKNWISDTDYYLHVGIYGYRADVLREISALPTGKLELSESLEQLRWLENGYAIHMDITSHESYGIDTPEDLENIKHML